MKDLELDLIDKNKSIRIAGCLTIQDWIELSSSLDVDKDVKWDIAFNFFEERIKTRYLNPINKILEMELKNGEGFAVVNLQCSLIETIECFMSGWVYEYPNFRSINDGLKFSGNEKIFESFFNNRTPFKELNIKACDFYKNVRCALLHETQTKKGWVIRKGSTCIYRLDQNEKIIYREAFQSGILKVIEEFKNIIINKKDINIRKNLKEKFNHISKLS